MKQAALKILSLFLCGLLIYNSLGYFVVLSVMRITIRQQKWAELYKLPNEQLTTFVFAKNKKDSRLKFVNDHEIIVNGKLYDIVRKTDEGGQVKFFCNYDHEEEALIAKTRLFNSKAQQMPTQNTVKLILEKIIKTCFVTKEPSNLTESSMSLFCCYQKSCYSGPTFQISLPPPQSFC